MSFCEKLADHLEAADVHKGPGMSVRVGIGCEANSLPSLAQSARLAREALDVGRGLGLRICPSNALRAEMLLSYISPFHQRQHIEQTLHNVHKIDDELSDTFLAWCRNPFSAGKVAQELSIHRNTLQYRLKKIKEIWGLDPWDFHDCFTLWSALILRKLERSTQEGEG
ncbi:MAG: helix-turn-helix domain-containing protein [Fretibacterium sp.]|nr:helix-turn-helix domain-containing protein [Fretibacterium sp.]